MRAVARAMSPPTHEPRAAVRTTVALGDAVRRPPGGGPFATLAASALVCTDDARAATAQLLRAVVDGAFGSASAASPSAALPEPALAAKLSSLPSSGARSLYLGSTPTLPAQSRGGAAARSVPEPFGLLRPSSRRSASWAAISGSPCSAALRPPHRRRSAAPDVRRLAAMLEPPVLARTRALAAACAGVRLRSALLLRLAPSSPPSTAVAADGVAASRPPRSRASQVPSWPASSLVWWLRSVWRPTASPASPPPPLASVAAASTASAMPPRTSSASRRARAAPSASPIFSRLAPGCA